VLLAIAFLHRVAVVVSDRHRPIQPASLKWQEDGELSQQDVFNLVCRLRAVEPGERSNELWRLGQKYPKQSAVADRVGLERPDSLGIVLDGPVAAEETAAQAVEHG
jgi:hypothetical protein